jgi:nitrite reductase (NO-forming)
VRPRATTALYQTTARVWLTLAALALLLPVRWRLGLWLPLHLALAGAVSTAISGAMQNFMLALTASPDPPGWTVRAQYALLVAGVAAIAVGMPAGAPWLTGTGGAAFTVAMAILAWMLWRAWRRSLHRRHPVPMAAYGAAVVFVLLGGALGALMGARVASGELSVHLRHAHMTVNVLGWAALTVVGTMVTFLPTVLRVRMPPARGWVALVLLVGGLLVQLVGWDLTSTPVLAIGGALYAAGSLAFLVRMGAVLRVERRWAIPLAAFHLLAGIAWFVLGAVGLAVALTDGPLGFDRYREGYLTAFVGGFLLQVLLGAWSFLLPMGTPGHPDERRRMLAVFEVAAPVQVVLLNAGLVLLAATAAGWLDLATVGAWLALAGGAIALGKAWLFPIVARGPVETDRARAVWGG